MVEIRVKVGFLHKHNHIYQGLGVSSFCPSKIQNILATFFFSILKEKKAFFAPKIS
jgi:hypothetical protein